MRTLLILLAMMASTQAASWEEKVVAAVLVGEARGEGRIGMIAVGEVIRQRSIERKQTIYRVVTSKGEFSSKNGRTAEQMVRRHSKDGQWSMALEVAHIVCSEPEKLPGITRSANAFDNKRGRPWWAAKAVRVAVIGNHAFYRLD